MDGRRISPVVLRMGASVRIIISPILKLSRKAKKFILPTIQTDSFGFCRSEAVCLSEAERCPLIFTDAPERRG